MENAMRDCVGIELEPEDEARLERLGNTCIVKESEFQFEFRTKMNPECRNIAYDHTKKIAELCWKMLANRSIKCSIYVRIEKQSRHGVDEFLVPLAKYPGTDRDLKGMQGSSWLKTDISYIWTALNKQKVVTNQAINAAFAEEMEVKSISGSEDYASVVAIPIYGKAGVVSLYSEESFSLGTIDPCVANTIATCSRILMEKVAECNRRMTNIISTGKGAEECVT